MLRVLIILLCVLGGVVLLLALVLLVLLNIRARLEFVGVSGDMTLDAVYGPVRVPLWPRPRHLKRKKNRKEDETEQKGEEEPAGGRFSLAKGGLPFGEIADIVLDFLGDLTGSLQITRLRVRLVLATGDAAKTGILLGQTAAAFSCRFWKTHSICATFMCARTRISKKTKRNGRRRCSAPSARSPSSGSYSGTENRSDGCTSC